MAIPRSTPRAPKADPPVAVADACPPIETLVQDIDVCFGPNDALPLTIGPGDLFDEMDPQCYVVRFASGEVVTIARHAVRWISRRQRVITTAAPVLQPAERA